MFSKPKQTPTVGSAPAPVPAKMATGARHTTFSILGSDVIVTGNISATVDLHVDGRVEGDLACANLVQGEESLIKGAIVAETARLAGTVDGSIVARDLTIQSAARITGDVTYENLTIEQGSKVEGRFSHRRAGAGAPGLTNEPAATPQLAEIKLG